MLAVGGIVADRIIDRAQQLRDEKGWHKRLAKAAAGDCDFDVSKRTLKRLLKSRPLQVALERVDESAEAEIACLVRSAVKSSVAQVKEDESDARSLRLAKALSLAFLRHLDQAYRDQVIYDRLARKIDARMQPHSGSVHESETVLPPCCREMLSELQKSDSALGMRISDYLADPAVMRPGVIAELVKSTPQWFDRHSSLAWETLGSFVAAHGLGGDFELQLEAIRNGTPRKGLYFAEEIVDASMANDLARSSELVAQAPADDALVRLARAALDGDAVAVRQILDDNQLEDSPDSSIARFALVRRVEALFASKELQQAQDVATSIVRRFPEFSVGHFVLADVLARRAVAESAGVALSRSLLRDALSSALKARDCKRDWNGPPGKTVEMATDICHLLDDVERVCDLAQPHPLGSATPQEASQPMVRRNLAVALAKLGRFDELGGIDLNDVPVFDQNLLRAWQAVQNEGNDAIELMRAAFDEATDDADKASALHGLAVLGIDPDDQIDAIQELLPGTVELLGGIAAHQRGEHELALERLSQARLESLACADLYGRILLSQDRVDDAYRHFETTAQRLNAPQMYCEAARCLIQSRSFEQAELLALRILALPASAEVEKAIRMILIEASAGQQHWRAMNEYALAAADRLGNIAEVGWATVVALVHQGKLEDAWEIFNTKLGDSADPQFYPIEIQLRSQFDPGLRGTDRLLELAATLLDDHERLAGAVSLLMTRHPERQWTEEQRAALTGLIRHLESQDLDRQFLEPISVPQDDGEALIEIMRERLEPGAIETAEHVDRVALGLLPYGTLRFVRELPYAETLVSVAAGSFTAISADEEAHAREREAAAAALGQAVVIDTSSIALWQTIIDDGSSVIASFSQVNVPEELATDVGWAQQSVLMSRLGTVGYNPYAQRLVLTEENAELQQELHSSLARVLEFMERCTLVPFGSYPWPDTEDRWGKFSPWDSSLRIASQMGRPLWVDDLALRQIALHLRIPSFGTYALLEALRDSHASIDLPSEEDFRRQLLRHRIGDVPFTWDEVDDLGVQEATSSVCFLLGRPANWPNVMKMFQWYRTLVDERLGSDRDEEIPALTYSAILGVCRATGSNGSSHLAVVIIATAINAGIDHEHMPVLIDAARQACRTLSPREGCDPLPAVVQLLVRGMSESFAETDIPRSAVVEYVVNLFSSMTEEDRHKVTRAILEMEEDE